MKIDPHAFSTASILKRLARLLLTIAPAISMAADWPQWRGPGRDGAAPSGFAPAAWPEQPRRVWSVSLGGGHSSPVVAGDRVIQHFHQGASEVVAALDLATGRELWRDVYPVSFAPRSEAQRHGVGPFATPVISEGRVFTFGIQEMLSAYDLATGRLLWRKDWSMDFSPSQPLYGTSASPLVADGKVIVYVGGPGRGSLVALDVRTGAIRWRLDGEGPPYGAAVEAVISSVRQVVTQSQASLLGVDLATGRKLWQAAFPVPWDNTILTPVVFGDYVLLSADDIDLQAFAVRRSGTTWSTTVTWRARQPMHMSSPILANSRLFGFTQLKKGQVFALDPTTGKVSWSSPGGIGQNAILMAAGRHLLVLSDDANLRILEAGDAYRQVASYMLGDAATWAHPALLDRGLMLVKDADKLTLWSFVGP
jgi:outer membrane protein assembly factor BamB